MKSQVIRKRSADSAPSPSRVRLLLLLSPVNKKVSYMVEFGEDPYAFMWFYSNDKIPSLFIDLHPLISPVDSSAQGDNMIRRSTMEPRSLCLALDAGLASQGSWNTFIVYTAALERSYSLWMVISCDSSAEYPSHHICVSRMASDTLRFLMRLESPDNIMVWWRAQKELAENI